MPDRELDRLVWIDCEMTGLDLSRDEIVEIACIVTDAELNALDEGVSVVVRPSDTALAGMVELVRDMHEQSGLLQEIPHGIGLADAEQAVLDYVTGHVPDPGRAPLAGSSVYVDRGFLARFTPRLDAHLHYRLVDVSSLKELVRRWYPRVYYSVPPKRGNHRALADIRDSIAELRYYREAVMVAAPGPSTEQAREIAGRHTSPATAAEPDRQGA
ncbi:MAG: oligoribonuclease [Actinomycetota bacterium]|nr:MAG: oligoribonuclease [Actinomycetota bacterium]